MERNEIARRFADYWLSCGGPGVQNALSRRPSMFFVDYDREAAQAFCELDRDGENEVVTQALRLVAVAQDLTQSEALCG